MPPSKPPVPQAAEPVYGQKFDPWNSSSTGHQRAENRLGVSTGWHTVGEGAEHWDSEAKVLITPETRSRAQCSVLDMLANPGKMKPSLSSSASGPSLTSGPVAAAAAASTSCGSQKGKSRSLSPNELTAEERLMARRMEEDAARELAKQPRKIFDGVVVYLNGSTHPLISDHKLKHVLAENGASMSSHLGRRKVTHVILGRHVAGGYGSGGGLAGGKLQKEISKIGGPAVKYVGVQWVLESIKAGRRLPEVRFADLKIASKGQQSVYGLYSKHKDKTPAGIDELQPPPSGQA
ncbi:hypothetical protein CHU98_g9250 [Xylaria longipes]|nr:hypothetical protein CHU98_g9250 [Xylaria longipes]